VIRRRENKEKVEQLATFRMGNSQIIHFTPKLNCCRSAHFLSGFQLSLTRLEKPVLEEAEPTQLAAAAAGKTI
jgi:hypothetical protein